MWKTTTKIFVMIIVLILFNSCSELDYRLQGYKKISFQWNSEVKEVFLDNNRINENEVYYANNAVHKIEWKQNGIERSYKIYIEKSGKYYIGDNRVYLFKKNIQVIDGK